MRTRRITRWLLLTTSTVVILLWLVSGFVHVLWGDGCSYQLEVYLGSLRISWGAPHRGSFKNMDFYEGVSFRQSWDYEWGWAPIPYGEAVNDWYLIAVPLWPLAAVACIVILRLYGRGRRRKGQCGTCGYDLRGNESEVCPECGEPILRERTHMEEHDR